MSCKEAFRMAIESTGSGIVDILIQRGAITRTRKDGEVTLAAR